VRSGKYAVGQQIEIWEPWASYVSVKDRSGANQARIAITKTGEVQLVDRWKGYVA